jgi:hypothetical protein
MAVGPVRIRSSSNKQYDTQDEDRLVHLFFLDAFGFFNSFFLKKRMVWMGLPLLCLFDTTFIFF